MDGVRQQSIQDKLSSGFTKVSATLFEGPETFFAFFVLALIVRIVLNWVMGRVWGILGFEGMDCQPPNALYTGAGGHSVCLQQRDDTGYEVPSYCQVPPLEARCDVQEAETKSAPKANAVAKAAESMWGGEAFLSGRGDGPRYVGSTSDIQQYYAAQGLTAPLTEGMLAHQFKESYGDVDSALQRAAQ
jgi:hypothetical protein